MRVFRIPLVLVLLVARPLAVALGPGVSRRGVLALGTAAASGLGPPRCSGADDSEDAALAMRIRDRRALMQAGRSTSSRQEIFDLSRQRATLVYNTTSKAATCDNPLGLPCL
ncbi:hypothetical protein M885DRAFT_520264 [Pelagophyceae sp. CCMP2097]|nr:hypothetical protein M885DRAFT_520264 [Pelagophyceae sp. CCMP2097]